MCMPDIKWPHYFYDLMYGVRWIERPFMCDTGEELKPDLTISSPTQNNCILFELKSGNNIDNAQAERYKMVRPKDVVSRLFVDVINRSATKIILSSESISNAS